MLRDDAIRAGLIKPTQADFDRGITEEDFPRPNQVFDTADKGEGIEAKIDLEDLTYKELVKKAEEMGIELPAQYIKKDALIELIKEKL